LGFSIFPYWPVSFFFGFGQVGASSHLDDDKILFCHHLMVDKYGLPANDPFLGF
jgi:hypothetical protein